MAENPVWMAGLRSAPEEFRTPFELGRQLMREGGNVPAAQQLLEQARSAAESGGHQELVAYSLCQLGHCHYAAGKREAAIQCHRRCREMATACNNHVLAMYCLGDIAFLLRELRMMEEAAATLEQQLTECRGCAEQATVASAIRGQLAGVYSEMEEHEKSAKHLEALLRSIRGTNQGDFELRVLERLAHTATHTGNHALADRCYDESIESARSAGQIHRQATLQLVAARVCADTGRFVQSAARMGQVRDSVPVRVQADLGAVAASAQTAFRREKTRAALGLLGLAATCCGGLQYAAPAD